MDAWISSRVLPLVSGTRRSTNTTVRPQMLANMKNVPEINPSMLYRQNKTKTSAKLLVNQDYTFDQKVHFLCYNCIYRRSSTAGGSWRHTRRSMSRASSPRSPGFLLTLSCVWGRSACPATDCVQIHSYRDYTLGHSNNYFNGLLTAEKGTSDIITHGIPPIPSEKDPLKIWFPKQQRCLQWVDIWQHCSKRS